MTPEKLAELEALCEKATELPWAVGGPWPRVSICFYTGENDLDVGVVGMEALFKATVDAKTGESCMDHADASYAVAAANALPALIARVRELEAENAELRRET